MKLSEDLVVLERFYSLSDTVNPILQDLILNSDDKSWIESSQGKYFLTNFAPFVPQDDELGSLVKWVQQIIYSDIVNIPLKCPEVWGVIYNKGDYINTHTHKQGDIIDSSTPNYFTFVYYVNAPDGSSPLVFPTSGHEIKAENGKVIIFESRLRHYIPYNECEGRYIIAGNFISSEESFISNS
jgi:hypothetical protein